MPAGLQSWLGVTTTKTMNQCHNVSGVKEVNSDDVSGADVKKFVMSGRLLRLKLEKTVGNRAERSEQCEAGTFSSKGLNLHVLPPYLTGWSH